MSAAAASVLLNEAPRAPAVNRVMVVIAVMSATMMQMLDTTIVNVALPQMQGQLGTTSSEISWVLTSYIVAASIFMPMRILPDMMAPGSMGPPGLIEATSKARGAGAGV